MCVLQPLAISSLLGSNILITLFPKDEGKVVRLLWAPRHEGVLGSGGIGPHILDLGTRQKWVVCFTPQLL